MIIFNREKHMRAFEALPWQAMFDEYGNTLEGIRGKAGATEIGSDGEEVGVDWIEMQPGSHFPLHTHPGDHILYAVSGRGTVFIDGAVREFIAGTTCYISGGYEHNVGTYGNDTEPFLLLAFGHPKMPIDSLNRMKLVESEDRTPAHPQ